MSRQQSGAPHVQGPRQPPRSTCPEVGPLYAGCTHSSHISGIPHHYKMHVLYLKVIHAFGMNMLQGSTRGRGVTQYCVIWKEEGSHRIVSTTRRKDHTALYHLQGGGIMQYCFIIKEERPHSVVLSTRRDSHSIVSSTRKRDQQNLICHM